jgi:hypothetical protein
LVLVPMYIFPLSTLFFIHSISIFQNFFAIKNQIIGQTWNIDEIPIDIGTSLSFVLPTNFLGKLKFFKWSKKVFMGLQFDHYYL